MKIEIGESLCYSYLRHVKQCWLVQTNWKSSDQWEKRKTDAELESMFRDMRLRFDMGGNVFKRTASVGQFMRQGEIDVVGLDQDGSIHAMDVAFHEAGLNYGGGVANRVLKKMLRAYILLTAYHPSETGFQIYFASPKVHQAVQEPLENIFAALLEHYPETDWHLLTNETWNEQVVRRTLEKTDSMADSAELFIRASKLLNLSAPGPSEPRGVPKGQSNQGAITAHPLSGKPPKTLLQDLVRGLMQTLLEECPTLLGNTELNSLMDSQYCKNVLLLKISNHALLRDRQQEREISGRSRYWQRIYGGKYYVCSEWWKDDHFHNANSLLKFLDRIERKNPDHPDVPKLNGHRKLLRDFVSAG